MGSAALHIARTGLDAQDMRMRVISNNLANVNTTGYKRDRAAFETLAYQTVTAPGAPSTAETRYATGLNLGTGVRIQGTARIDTQGTLSQTGNSLDVALDGEGKEQKQAQQPAYPAESAGMPLMAMSTAEQLAFAAEYAALLVGLWLAWSVLCILAGSAFAGYTAGELAAGFLLFATAVDGAIFLAF